MKNYEEQMRVSLIGEALTYIIIRFKSISSHNSRLYNEKAYVLSRGFIRRGLDGEAFTLDVSNFNLSFHRSSGVSRARAPLDLLRKPFASQSARGC